MTMSEEEVKVIISTLIAINDKIAPFMQYQTVRQKFFDELSEETKKQSNGSFLYLSMFLERFQNNYYKE